MRCQPWPTAAAACHPSSCHHRRVPRPSPLTTRLHHLPQCCRRAVSRHLTCALLVVLLHFMVARVPPACAQAPLLYPPFPSAGALAPSFPVSFWLARRPGPRFTAVAHSPTLQLRRLHRLRLSWLLPAHLTPRHTVALACPCGSPLSRCRDSSLHPAHFAVVLLLSILVRACDLSFFAGSLSMRSC